MPKLKEADASARREQIVDVAMRCFTRKGFAGTSITDICEEGDLSTGALYTYFASKEEIFEAVLDRWSEWRKSRFKIAGDQPSALEGIDSITDSYVRATGEVINQEWMRLAVRIWVEAMVNEKADKMLRRNWTDRRERLVNLIQEGIKKGEIQKDVDADALARVLISTYLGMILQKVREPELDEGKMREMLKRLYWTGVGTSGSRKKA